jgi:DNA (cytosine-5)-methyltransferase 1
LDFPKLKLEFNERAVTFGEIEDLTDLKETTHTEVSKYWDKTPEGNPFSYNHSKGNFFNDNKLSKNEVCNTLTADKGHGAWHYSIKRKLNKLEICKIGTYPLDYNFKSIEPKYLIGMSVPPVMTAQIANQIAIQWQTIKAQNQ